MVMLVCGVGVFLRLFRSLIRVCSSGVKLGLKCFLWPFGTCALSASAMIWLNWATV